MIVNKHSLEILFNNLRIITKKDLSIHTFIGVHIIILPEVALMAFYFHLIHIHSLHESTLFHLRSYLKFLIPSNLIIDKEMFFFSFINVR